MLEKGICLKNGLICKLFLVLVLVLALTCPGRQIKLRLLAIRALLARVRSGQPDKLVCLFVQPAREAREPEGRARFAR